MPMWRKVFQIRRGKQPWLCFWRRFFWAKNGEIQPEPTQNDRAKGLSRRRVIVFSASLLAIASVLLVCSPAQADWAKDIVNWIVAIFTKVLVYIIELLAYILIQLVDILIQIVQFNNFVKASPVRIGWPLMRDTVNMFFIIVVLVSAFATIIGYPKEFHYRGILPKLLLMAILINFSKTLIGLMIDFSQVVVLTFVNGFKAAAGGNFVNALHISEIMNIETGNIQLVTQSGGEVQINASKASDVSIYQIFNMMLAAIFGIWMLSISITLIIIMLVFFLARIIILWFLLITSPVMFFAWALPGKLQKAFSAFTDQWWNRLSSALIGGPVMAFFLWLSLAIAQGSNGPDALTGTTSQTSLYKNQSTEAANVATGAKAEEKLGPIVVTKIGNSDNFANFVIMIAFMLVGVQFAVQSSQALAPKLGGLATAVAGTGGAMGVGVALTAAGARAAGKGAAWAGGRADERLGISAFAAKKALQHVPAGMMTTGMRAGLAKAAAAPQVRAKTKAEELKKSLAYLPPDMAMKQAEAMATSKLSSKETKMAGAMLMAQQAKSGVYAKNEMNKEKESIAADRHGVKYENLDAEKRAAVDAEAKQRVNEGMGQKLGAANKLAKDYDMADLREEIKEIREKNPALFTDVKEREAAVIKDALEPNKDRKMMADAFMDLATTLQFLKTRDKIDEKGNWKVDPSADQDVKDLMRGRQGQLIASTLDFVQNTEDGKQRAQTILDPKAKDDVREAANATINSTSDGLHYSVALKPTKAGEQAEVITFNMGGASKDSAQILSGVSDASLVTRLKTTMQGRKVGGKTIESIGRRLGNNDRARDLADSMEKLGDDSAAWGDADYRTMSEMLTKGLIDANGLFGIDAEGKFQSREGEKAYRAVVGDAYKNINAGLDTEINLRIVTSAMAGTKGEALAAHGQEMQAKGGYQGLRNALDTAAGDQARQFREGMRDIMNEAAVAVRAKAAGATPTAAQATQIDNAEFIKGTKTKVRDEKSTGRAAVRFLSGRDEITIV